jgi:hypothetical protein
LKSSSLDVTTANVTALHLRDLPARCRIVIDGTVIENESSAPDADTSVAVLARAGLAANGAWGVVDAATLPLHRKRPGLTGPIDEAFDAPFVVVPPVGPGLSPAVDRFVAEEFAHLKRRWHDLYRGELPVVEANDVTDEILRTKHLVLFGDESSNPLIARAVPGLPLRWTPEGIVLGPGTAGERRFPGAGHVPVLIHPNPLAPAAATRYVVLNSGFTFREEHDVNNALQNRRLPDWAVIDLAVPPDGRDPGRIVAADFFDEAWGVKPPE